MTWKRKRMSQLARESMTCLFDLAEKECVHHPERAHRYVKIARDISMRTRVRIPHHLKKKFCSKCHHFLIYGRTCRVRTKSAKVVITCLECGNIMRVPFVREKKVGHSKR